MGGSRGGAATPENWEQMPGTQRQKWHKHRRKKEIKTEAPEEKLVAMGETKEASSPPLGLGFAFAARQGHSGGIGIGIAGDERKPGRSVWAFRAMHDRALPPSMGAAARRQTTGGCPAISGATLVLSLLSAPGWPSCLY